MAVMRVDIAPYKQFAAVGGVSLFAIVIALIVGGSGPHTTDSIDYYAYGCPIGSHTWSADCTGVQMNDNSSYWIYNFNQMKLLNQFWTLEVFPWNSLYETQALDWNLDVEVILLATNNASSDEWIILSRNNTAIENIQCKRGIQECSGVLLIYEEFIQYSFYQVSIRFPESSSSWWIGDVRFHFGYGHAAFAAEEIAIRVIFLR